MRYLGGSPILYQQGADVKFCFKADKVNLDFNQYFVAKIDSAKKVFAFRLLLVSKVLRLTKKVLQNKTSELHYFVFYPFIDMIYIRTVSC